jgi:hypothetical protein
MTVISIASKSESLEKTDVLQKAEPSLPDADSAKPAEVISDGSEDILQDRSINLIAAAKANAEKLAKLKLERSKNNQEVLKSYRIK